jgi:hypothetical protein
MMENSEIIDLALMCVAVDQSPGDEALAKRYAATLAFRERDYPAAP